MNFLFFLILLQSSVSHDPSEIILMCWFGAQETFLIIIVGNIFVEALLKILSWIENSKEKHLFEVEIFCKSTILAVYCLLAKQQQKNLTDPKLLNSYVLYVQSVVLQ